MFSLTYEFEEYPAVVLDSGEAVGFLSGSAGVSFNEDGITGIDWIVLHDRDGNDVPIKRDCERQLFDRLTGLLTHSDHVKGCVEEELDKLGYVPSPAYIPLTAQQLGVGSFGSFAR